MATTIKDVLEKEIPNAAVNPDLQAILADVASLKRDLAVLAGHLKLGALNATTGAVSATEDATRKAVNQVSEEASRLYDTLAAKGERSAEALSRQVEEQPIASLLIAFGLGFIGSRLLSR